MSLGEQNFGKYGSKHHLVIVDVNKEGIEALKSEGMTEEVHKLIHNIATQINLCISGGGEVIFINEGSRPTFPELRQLTKGKTFKQRSIIRYFGNEDKKGISYSVVGLSACLCVPCVAESLQSLSHNVRILVGSVLGYTKYDCSLEEVARNNGGNLSMFFFPQGQSQEKTSLIEYL